MGRRRRFWPAESGLYKIMLLALDAGNTNITIGAFEGEKLLRVWRLATDLRKTADEYGVALKALWPAELSRAESVT